MPDVFARLAARLTPPQESEGSEVWGERTLYEPVEAAATGERTVRVAREPASPGETRPCDPEVPAAVAGHPGPGTAPTEPAPVGRAPAAARSTEAVHAAARRLREVTPSGPPPVRASRSELGAPRSLDEVIALLEPGTEVRSAPRPATHPSAPAEVTVEIGQIVVRPPVSSAAPAAAAPATATAGILSLSDYLAGRR